MDGIRALDEIMVEGIERLGVESGEVRDFVECFDLAGELGKAGVEFLVKRYSEEVELAYQQMYDVF